MSAVPWSKATAQVLPQLIPAGELVTVPEPDLLTVTVNCGGGATLKVAVTDVAPLTVGLQAPVPEQAPLQPANTMPLSGVAVRLTLVPEAKLSEQVAPQLIRPGVPVTVPVPVPFLATDSVNLGTKLADTDCAALMVTMHVPVPEQEAPLQPVKAEPDAAVAVSVTWVSARNDLLHVLPQLIPLGALETLPEPVPVLLTVRVNCGAGEKVAVTATGAVPMVMSQVMPEQSPLKPAKTEKLSDGVGVRETAVLVA